MRQVSTRRRWLRLGLSFVPALLIGLFFVGAVAVEAVEANQATVNIEIGDDGPRNFFNPANITVNVGDTVVWTHTGNRPHDVTSVGDGPLNSPRRMMRGATYSFTATTAGTFNYECTIHEGQDGTLIVQAATAPAAPAAQPTTPSAAPRTGMGALAGGPASAWALVAGLGLLLSMGLVGRIAARRRSA